TVEKAKSLSSWGCLSWLLDAADGVPGSRVPDSGVIVQALTEPMRIKIAPSILSADFTRLGEQVKTVESAGVDRVQIDVMDGRFVPNITFGTLAVECLRPITRLTLEVHLMVTPPEEFIEKFARAGADTLIVHQEATPHLHRVIQQIHGLGKKAGVALNPGTPANLLSEVLGSLQLVLVMTVNPAFGGQEFIPEMLGKI